MEVHALELIETITLADLLTALIAINFFAFAAFGIDKSRAERGQRRISEAALLQLALIGGTPGAYVGRHLFRHKTRKQPFSSYLLMIAVLQAAVCLACYAMVHSA